MSSHELPIDSKTADEFVSWWRTVTENDLAATLPKIGEYGAADLKIMGEAMVSMHPNLQAMDERERGEVGIEMAIAFYLLGKVSRLFGAYQSGGRPSDDTWHDTSVYAMMGRRVRETGGWPS